MIRLRTKNRSNPETLLAHLIFLQHLKDEGLCSAIGKQKKESLIKMISQCLRQARVSIWININPWIRVLHHLEDEGLIKIIHQCLRRARVSIWINP